MTTVVGRLAKNKMVRDLQGNIIDWYDEAQGGWIVQKRMVVNADVWNSFQAKLKDKAESAKAATMAKIREDNVEAPQTNKKVEELEKKVENLDNKLDQILSALKK